MYCFQISECMYISFLVQALQLVVTQIQELRQVRSGLSFQYNNQLSVVLRWLCC